MTETNGRLLLATEGEQTVDTQARTITGLVVPFNAEGYTSGGRLRFQRGSLKVSDPKRVKLLREHDQTADVIGYGVEFTETDAGLVGTFHVPETEHGSRALAEAALGLRDAFSVGAQLDDKTMTAMRRSQGAVVDATGQLREVSLVSVPAFDDARVAAGTSALVVSSWSTTPQTPTAAGGGTTPTTGVGMTEQTAGATTTAAAETTTAAAVTTPEQPATATAAAPTGPAVVPAVAGAAMVAGEPSTYTFGAGGPSLVADLYHSAMHRDSEAAERVARFNAELAGGNPASLAAFVTAAATRDDYDGAGTNVPEVLAPSPKPLLADVIDAKRPFISRLDRVPITNAQPFAVPGVTAEFEGVGEHTEGTPHRPAGTLTLSGGSTVQPTATSGAWEVSRELVDATNPAIDRVAARAMLNDYRRKSETKLINLLVARAAQEGSTVYAVDNVLAMRAAMLDFVNDDEEGADLVAVSKGLLRTFGLDTDTTERPQLPFIGPVNAAGTMRAGYTGVAIDGVEMFRSARLDAALGTAATPTGNVGNGDAGVIARSEGILWAESNVLQFRFDEVLGPGVIKLALWAYTGAAILDVADVAIVRAGADPTP